METPNDLKRAAGEVLLWYVGSHTAQDGQSAATWLQAHSEDAMPAMVRMAEAYLATPTEEQRQKQLHPNGTDTRRVSQTFLDTY